MHTPPKSQRALKVIALVEKLQKRFANALQDFDGNAPTPISWLRDEGKHGGGTRMVLRDSKHIDRASVNVSCVHYDDLPHKKLSSATALSAIVHPAFSAAPSMHTHISFTEMRSQKSGWRMMADLNPSQENAAHTEAFKSMLKESAPELYEEASARGDRYFTIPALERTRGVAHFYLEGHDSGDFEKDAALAEHFGEKVIDTYCKFLNESAFENDEEKQLDYHTLYFFQVLTLDRGTTSGILVHNQNDVGILGSLPSRVKPELLRAWLPKLQKPQDRLLKSLIDIVSDGEVSDDKKPLLAQRVREHYKAHPEALALQASGDKVPSNTPKTSAENHR